jgi:transcription-repair coupling factor (superfamily II helicase)
MLDEAVRTVKGEEPPLTFDPDINLQVNARLPEDFIPDNHLRLVLYKRLANANDEEDVLAVADEMVDRFGHLPPVVENLIEVMRIRTLARYIGLNTVSHSPTKVSLAFHPQTPMPISAILDLVQRPSSPFHAPGDFKLTYTFDAGERRDTVPSTRMCLQRLAEFVTDSATGSP